MNTNKRVVLKDYEAREKLIKGADFLADIVGSTIGPGGRNVVMGVRGGTPHITNDGVSIAKEIFLDDEIEDLGARMIREAALRANDKAGDGTTTATVLAQAIIHEAASKLPKPGVIGGANPIQLKRQIDQACKEVVAELRAMAKPVETEDDLVNVATISVESEEHGKLIGEMAYEIGKDGAIIVERNHVAAVTGEMVNAFRMSGGFALSQMINDFEKVEVRAENCPVLVTDHTINTLKDLEAPLGELVRVDGKRWIVIVAKNFGPQAITDILANAKQNVQIVAINAQYLHQKDILQDLAAYLGATFIDCEGDDITATRKEHFGSVDLLRATRGESYFVGGGGVVEQIYNRIDEIRAQQTQERSDHEKAWLDKRIAALSGSIALIKVGAMTEQEENYWKDKIDDAVNAVKWAHKEGVVPGAGTALKTIAETLETNILTEALKAPYNKIKANLGEEPKVDETVIDPVKVTITALENACSVAGTFITNGAAINTRFPKDADAILKGYAKGE